MIKQQSIFKITLPSLYSGLAANLLDIGETTMIGDFLEDGDISNLVELLIHRAKAQPDKTAYIFLVNGDTEEIELTYSELDKQARSIAAELQRQFSPGERALLIYPPGLEFISAFFGCLYAGIIAVPCYPLDSTKLDASMAGLRTIIVDCTPEIILTTKIFLDLAAFIFPDYPDLEKMNWLATDAVNVGLGDNWKEPDIHIYTTAYLQYTSGSTGMSKGVIISHSNVLHNVYMMWKVCGHSTFFGWVPTYHDLGLVGHIFCPLYISGLSVLISPVAFSKKPVRWIKGITRYKANVTSGANFALELCVRYISKDQKKGMDLSSLSMMVLGAEPIYHATLHRFLRAFQSCGLSEKMLYPCYGLAEATLSVSGKTKGSKSVFMSFSKEFLSQNQVVMKKARHKDVITLVSSGKALTNEKIVIVHHEKLTQCNDGQVGEVWVSGPNVAQGYWNKPELTKTNFKAYLSDISEGPFLRTGDLGFMKDGELFVTGRLKDLIIIRGKNHYPQDIERTVEQSHDSARPGCSAAFSVEIDKEEKLVVVQEVKVSEDLDSDTVISAIRKAVASQHALRVYAVVLIEAGNIPKTSSGKIKRNASKTAFLNKKFKEVSKWQQSSKKQYG